MSTFKNVFSHYRIKYRAKKKQWPMLKVLLLLMQLALFFEGASYIMIFLSDAIQNRVINDDAIHLVFFMLLPLLQDAILMLGLHFSLLF